MNLKIRQIVILFMVIALAVPLVAHATVVGHFTLVRGRVDLLKQGKLPAVPAKLQAGVEPGDIIRTKSRSKAQLTMVDGSIITLAPMSRLAVADYQYHPARQERRACCASFAAWCTPWSNASSGGKSLISSWRPTPRLSACAAPIGSPAWVQVRPLLP